MITALQTALPGAPGVVELGVILLVALVLAAVVGRWVYRDARSRGNDWAWQWAVGVVVAFLLGLVPGLLVFTAYMFLREDRVEATA